MNRIALVVASLCSITALVIVAEAPWSVDHVGAGGQIATIYAGWTCDEAVNGTIVNHGTCHDLWCLESRIIYAVGAATMTLVIFCAMACPTVSLRLRAIGTLLAVAAQYTALILWRNTCHLTWQAGPSRTLHWPWWSGLFWAMGASIVLVMHGAYLYAACCRQQPSHAYVSMPSASTGQSPTTNPHEPHEPHEPTPDLTTVSSADE